MVKVKTSIFALIDDCDALRGYFKTEQAALNHIEREELNEAIVLEVVAAWEAFAPEEPKYMLNDKKLSEIVKWQPA